MQNKPKAELTAALMLLDTRSMSFDMREIDNRRFMFSPQAGELILGRQYRGGQLYKSHAEEHFDSGAKAPFDSFIRGWIGTGRDYPDGVIHFAPNIGTDNIPAFDNAFSTLQMFSENGAAGDTVVRGFGRKWEQPHGSSRRATPAFLKKPSSMCRRRPSSTHPTNGRKQIMNGSSAVTQSIRCAIMSMKTPAMTDRRKNPCRIHGA